MALAAKLVGWGEPAAGDLVVWCSDADRARTRPKEKDGKWPDAAVVVVGAPADGYRDDGGGGARGLDVVGAALELSERLDDRYGLVLPLALRAW